MRLAGHDTMSWLREEREIMQNPSKHSSSLAKCGVKWLLLSLAFVWLVGCVGLSAKNKRSARDPFAEHKFSCGEDMPPAVASPLKGRG